MIEVFKTNVTTTCQATALQDLIHLTFSGYRANFDLDDCDRILRIKSSGEPVCVDKLIGLLNSLGYFAAVLTDEVYEGTQGVHTSTNQMINP
jgi:hypothetical protein